MRVIRAIRKYTEREWKRKIIEIRVRFGASTLVSAREGQKSTISIFIAQSLSIITHCLSVYSIRRHCQPNCGLNGSEMLRCHSTLHGMPLTKHRFDTHTQRLKSYLASIGPAVFAYHPHKRLAIVCFSLLFGELYACRGLTPNWYHKIPWIRSNMGIVSTVHRTNNISCKSFQTGIASNRIGWCRRYEIYAQRIHTKPMNIFPIR